MNHSGLALVALGVGMILSDADIPGFSIGLPLLGAIATLGGLTIICGIWLASRSARWPVVTGVQGMVGDTAEVFQEFTAQGRVRYGGEIWNAYATASLHDGQTVRIVKVAGLTLWVEPV